MTSSLIELISSRKISGSVMQFRVPLKITSRAKVSCTEVALWALICVNTHVYHKIRLFMILFAASFQFTLVLGFFLVSIHVLHEIPSTFEGAKTRFEQAFVGFGLVLVQKTMLHQMRLKFELFLALISLAAVDPDLHL